MHYYFGLMNIGDKKVFEVPKFKTDKEFDKYWRYDFNRIKSAASIFGINNKMRFTVSFRHPYTHITVTRVI